MSRTRILKIVTEANCQSACKCTLCRFSSGKSSTGAEFEILPRPGSIYAVTVAYTCVCPGFFAEEAYVLLVLTIAGVTTFRETLYYADAL